MAMATAAAAAAAASSSLLAPAAGTAASAHNAVLFPSSLPSLRAYPRLLTAFRRPAAAAVADPQGAVLEEEEVVVVDQGGRYDDDGYEGGRGPAFTPPTKLRTGKAALPLKRDRTRSRRFLEIQKLRESKKEYDVPTSISLMKQMSCSKFVETAEAHFRMNLDPKYNDQQLRATVNLPKGTGQTVKIAVLTQGIHTHGPALDTAHTAEEEPQAGSTRRGAAAQERRVGHREHLHTTQHSSWQPCVRGGGAPPRGGLGRGRGSSGDGVCSRPFKRLPQRTSQRPPGGARCGTWGCWWRHWIGDGRGSHGDEGEKIDEARAAGVDIVGGDDLIEQIKGGFMEFDKLIASPDMMPKVASLGKILGPRGLMPNPKAGTVSPNITQAIDELKKGKVEYRVDKTGTVHIPFGKVDFPVEDLIANFMAVVRSVERNKPSGAKGIYWKTAYLCSSMGPSIKLNVKEMLDYDTDSSD